METTINNEKYMKDHLGRFVPLANVEEVDLLRDELVRKIVSRGIELNAGLKALRDTAMSEIDNFVDLSAMEYGAKIGGKKGNLTLRSFDHSLEIKVQTHEFLVFDERLQAAKALIDECFNEWSEDIPNELKIIITDAFQVNKEGKINTGKVLALRRHKIENDLWQRAMKAIADSIQVTGSKRYMRIYQRDGQDGAARLIPLDFAAV